MIRWADKEAAIRSLEKNGRISPDDLVAAARAKGHPCHGDFTWDLKKAARERWRDQARGLIRRVRFEVEIAEATERVVMYVPDDGDGDEHVFRSLPRIRSRIQAGGVLAAEVAQLCGAASRAYGIALAKQALVGPAAVDQLRAIRDLAAELRWNLS